MPKRFKIGQSVFVIGHNYYRVFGPVRVVAAKYGHKAGSITHGGPFYQIAGGEHEWFAEKHLGTLTNLIDEVNRLTNVEYEAYHHAKSIEEACRNYS
jgi:hypothetical protein